MKKLIWKLIIPTSLISFMIFTKWWYVLPIDAPDTMMGGFPLIWVSDGWHTSMSLQIFVLEFIIDFLTFFLFWFLMFFLIHKYIRKVHPDKYITIPIWSISGFIIIGAIFVGSMPEHMYLFKRENEVKVLDTGYKFIWQNPKRPDLSDYNYE